MKKTIIKYGVIGGVLVSLLFLGPIVLSPKSYMQPENMATGEVVGYSVMILCMTCVFFGVRAYSRNHDATDFSFMKGLGIGIQITLLANVIFYISNVILYEVIAPDFLSTFGEFYKTHLIENATDQKSKELALAEFNAQASILENSYLYALVMAGSTFFIGIIISLISALTFKHGKKPN